MVSLSSISSHFQPSEPQNHGLHTKVLNGAKAILTQHVATVAGVIIHEMGHVLAAYALFKTPIRMILLDGGTAGVTF